MLGRARGKSPRSIRSTPSRSSLTKMQKTPRLSLQFLSTPRSKISDKPEILQRRRSREPHPSRYREATPARVSSPMTQETIPATAESPRSTTHNSPPISILSSSRGLFLTTNQSYALFPLIVWPRSMSRYGR